MAGPEDKKREKFWKGASSVRQRKKSAERHHKIEIARKMWLQNEGDGGEKCGDLMWQGVGSCLGGFLDCGPALRAEGRVLSSPELRSLLAPSAAG